MTSFSLQPLAFSLSSVARLDERTKFQSVHTSSAESTSS